ncbi:hypothetical protein WG924_06195 [Tistrella sp. 25B02-3]
MGDALVAVDTERLADGDLKRGVEPAPEDHAGDEAAEGEEAKAQLPRGPRHGAPRPQQKTRKLHRTAPVVVQRELISHDVVRNDRRLFGTVPTPPTVVDDLFCDRWRRRFGREADRRAEWRLHGTPILGRGQGGKAEHGQGDRACGERFHRHRRSARLTPP